MNNVILFKSKPVATIHETIHEPLTVPTIRLAEALLTIMVVDKDKEATEQALLLFADAVRKGYTVVDVTSQSVLKYIQYLEGGHEGYSVVCDTMNAIRAGRI